MHLVRIKVKPRAQHGTSTPSDQVDPLAVTIRHGHEVPTPSPQPPRFKSPVWKLLPFANKVSNMYLYLDLKSKQKYYIF
jgi:hypothetical protein